MKKDVVTANISKLTEFFELLIQIDRKEMKIGGTKISESVNKSCESLLQRNALR
jgi:hypothetical protein